MILLFLFVQSWLSILIDCIVLNHPIEFIYKKNGVLNCSDISWGGAVNVSFYSYDLSLNLIQQIQTDSIKYFINEETNVLTIHELRRNDVNKTYFCNSTNGDRINFMSQVWPYMYKPESQSISVVEDSDAQITCYLLVGVENNQRITWMWELNKKILKSNDKYAIEDDEAYNTTLTVRNAQESDRGEYYCIGVNKFGNYTRKVTLRVRGKYAALWPFIGLFVEVAVLLIIIFYFEIKNKKERKNR